MPLLFQPDFSCLKPRMNSILRRGSRHSRRRRILGILQVHLSGGEPTLRPDLEDLVGALASRGVYTNLITAGVTLTPDRIKKLVDCGLDHVQLSLQALDPETSDKIGNYKRSLDKKLNVARWVREAGLPLTINAPTHRHNIGQTPALIELALELGADRLEIAHVQYYGWAARNRAALMPPYERVLEEAAVVGEAKDRLKGILNIDYVTPDYYAQFPKPCMGGWAKDVITIKPEGKVLPCHAAESLPLPFDNVKDKPLAAIWYDSKAFNRFRGYEWMKEPCRSCPRKEIDFGGCRCQAFALTGDAEATEICVQSFAGPSPDGGGYRGRYRRRAAALYLSPHRPSLAACLGEGVMKIRFYTAGPLMRRIGLPVAAAVISIGIGMAPIGVSAKTAGLINDYPTSARADYVFGCMKANGDTRTSLEQCSCSIDVIATILPYDRYVEAEAVLSLAQVPGGFGEMFRSPEPAKTAVNAMRRAQA